MTGQPLDDFRDLLTRLPPLDEPAAARTRATFERWTEAGSRLAEAAARIAGVSGRAPAVNRPSVALFAATHGVARRFRSSFPADAAEAFVAATGTGHAPINHLCSAHGFGLKVYDLALDLPTGDIAVEAALDERACAATMAFGMEAVAGADLIVLGAARSPGQEAAGAALLAACLGEGTGRAVLAELPAAARPAVQEALSLHGDPNDPFEALRRLGGREFAALAGTILAARMERMAVVLDGPAALAAAAVLFAAEPNSIAHCFLAEASDPAWQPATARLGLEPLLAAGMSAGEGTAGVLAAALLRDAATLHTSLLKQSSGRA